jgi:hypothetical protein
MFIFIDESGSTDIRSSQRYLIVAFAFMNNRDFAERLIFEIKDQCKAKGKPIRSKEVRYHDLEPLQKEIAVQILNSKYRDFYICFLDLEKIPSHFATGEFEHLIQKDIINSLLVSLDSDALKKYEKINIIMDKKLNKNFQESIRAELQKHLHSKKGIYVETASSSSERGIQVADVIAGAFRAKLLKKSDLFHVDLNRVFQIVVPA